MIDPSPRPEGPRLVHPSTIAVALVAFAGGLLVGGLPRLANWGPPVVAVAIAMILTIGTVARRAGRSRCPACGQSPGRFAPRPDPWSGPPDLDDGDILSPTHAELVKHKRIRSPGSPNGPGLMP
ncbi:hypothetical protein TA3x_002179 [Tundrisphaera sp. TA3]|uniref:hypothetical protein n=1 Tax=Tundrisphaera sp. TA3 TaxID=3435775 RepID=UPI003EBB5585